MDCHACTALDCALGAPMPPFHSWEVAVCLVGLHYNACSVAFALDPEACWSVAVAAACSIYTHQSGWTIPDHQLRSAVKRVIKDDLLDTYQDFLRRWVPGLQGVGLRVCVVCTVLEGAR
jgi:hypothetical protein